MVRMVQVILALFTVNYVTVELLTLSIGSEQA